MAIAEKFWAKVVRGPGCWEWSGSRGEDGYGALRLAKRGPGCHLRAHRASWMIHYGDIPEGLDVLHRCDNPPCVNPAHLFLGTRADNNRDRATKGRSATGERSGPSRYRHLFQGDNNGRHILTAGDVRALRDLRENGWTQRALAERFGVARRTVRSVLDRRSWGHVQ